MFAGRQDHDGPRGALVKSHVCRTCAKRVVSVHIGRKGFRVFDAKPVGIFVCDVGENIFGELCGAYGPAYRLHSHRAKKGGAK